MILPLAAIGLSVLSLLANLRTYLSIRRTQRLLDRLEKDLWHA